MLVDRLAALRAGCVKAASASRDEITDLLDQTGALAQMVLKAHPLDKADLFQDCVARFGHEWTTNL
ncbi:MULTISPECIES: hypothetical protein [Thermomonosporaceae]|uniref:hypothetical protein n=1 Tax=Thermomonosporaceae TaxID=2012 RepID=UPI00255A8F70|nr:MULTISPECIES: hypothetical protein [Thermomonosporaceae]MDL4773950.1 hypothetical protein [Actinomadura xylanilytica]